MIIAYLICYPQTVQKILEDLDCFNFAEKILASALEQISSLIFENPDIQSDELVSALPQDITETLKSEIEMLKKSERSDRQIIEELHDWIQNARIKVLEGEIDLKTKQYMATGDPEIWGQITVLKQEIQNLKETE